MKKTTLGRYWRVREGLERARYLESKSTMLEISEKSSYDELATAQSEALKRGSKTSGDMTLLEVKTEMARRILAECVLCERKCGADRNAGQKGHCRVLEPRISSEFIHMGEEPELVPSYTIFFAGCTFDCVYCQNYDISTAPESGMMIPPDRLARMIESKAESLSRTQRLVRNTGGVANVNWVGGDPTSNLHFILQTMGECRANLPQVWNSNMYLSEVGMDLLKGVVDVYLTDFKYGNDGCAKRLSNVDDYTRVVRRNHILAVEDAEVIIRHLVLPNHLECCTRPVLTWIADNMANVKVNVMGQYRPCHHAMRYEELSRNLKPDEYESALAIAIDLGLDLTG